MFSRQYLPIYVYKWEPYMMFSKIAISSSWFKSYFVKAKASVSSVSTADKAFV